jgi:hypothetical protein
MNNEVMRKIDRLLEELTPYMCEEFMKFPLWEEGNYAPTISIWQEFNELPEDVIYNEIHKPSFVGGRNVYVWATYKKSSSLTNEFMGIGIPPSNKFFVEYEIGTNEENEINLKKLLKAALDIVYHYHPNNKPAKVKNHKI